MTGKFARLGSLVVAGLVSLPGVAAAQGGAVVNGTVAAAMSEDTTSFAFGGGVTYRFNRALGLGVELTQIQNIDNLGQALRPRGKQPEGDATMFTTNVRLEVPTTSGRVIPFVVGGGGIANLTESFPVVYARLAQSLANILPGPSSITSSTLNMALTLGGGASFLLGSHVSVDVDLRVIHLLGDSPRNIGLFGGGASYWF